MDAYIPFVPFGYAHIITMCVIGFSALYIPLLLRSAKAVIKIQFARVLALLLVVSETGKPFVSVLIYHNPVNSSLPLHLCGVAAFLTAWVLWDKNYRSYEIAYFWGVGGGIPAMLTPDLMAGFPSVAFFYFFISHGLILLGVMFATAVYGFRPRFTSIGKAIVATFVLMAVVAPVNVLFGSNYMYLQAKPQQLTLMEYMGEWPWYILSLIMIGTIVFLVCYLPFLYLSKREQ